MTLAARGWLVDCIATPISAFSQALFLRNDAPESIVFETHGDGTVDRATLVDNGEALDLNIFVGDNTTHDASRKRHQFLPRNGTEPPVSRIANSPSGAIYKNVKPDVPESLWFGRP